MRKKPIQAEVERFFPNFEDGLNYDQVKIRNDQKLNNKIKDDTKKQYLIIILSNIFTFYNVLLFTIGIFLLIANFQEQWTNCFFMVVVIANTTIGLVQDLRSKYKRDKLTIIDTKKVECVRSSKIINIDIDDIVLDDILHLKEGDQVPCDSFILSGSVMVDESILTGESLPIKKVAGAGIMSGSYILSGSVFAKVIAVGKENYANKIQTKTKNYKAPKSQMYLQLNRLFKIISGIVIFVGLLTIISKGLVDSVFSNYESFQKEIAPIAGALISMIPSGMYLLISTTLTVGVINLSGKKVLVQDMYSIETLARCDTLCLDKTGTITDGNMSVYDTIILDNSPFSKDRLNVIISSYLNAVGDSNFTAKAMCEFYGVKNVFGKISALQFSTYNKYSSATLEDVGTITIGAFGYVPINDVNEDVKKIVDEYSSKSYRVLVVGWSKKAIKNNKSPEDMVPVALILIQDRIRENAAEIIGWFINKGVNIKVISGDNPLTVQEIAKKVGISNSDKYISLEGLSIDEVREAAFKYNIFGRVTPEQKEIIIDVLKENKHVVGMFGDGVNDLLALKASNVGITVGSANSAAKDLANIILYNDDFGSLPDVIAQGRRVINNLQRTCSLFLIKTLYAILINIFFLITAATIKLTYPFEPAHFYGWDVICIGVAAFFLALEKNNEEIVKGSFLRNIFKAAAINGIVMAVEVMILFLLTNWIDIGYKNEVVTFAVYFMAGGSVISLFGVSYPFDKFRLTVFIMSIIGTAMIFLLSYVSPWNIVKLERSTSFAHIAIIDGIMLLIMMALALGLYRLFEKIFSNKRRERS
jgi:cation-transporting P-type ATPase E